VLSAAAFAAPPGDFPARAVRIIVPSAPGGSTDLVARTVAHKLAEVTGQPVLVENRHAVYGVVGTELVAQAAADGYTLLMAAPSLIFRPNLLERLTFDVLRDFEPVSLVATAPFVLVLHPSLPVATVRRLIAFAKARPGELNYASAARGSSPHVAAELFKYLAGVNIVRVPYKAGAPALTSLVGGETHLGFFAVVLVSAHVRAGRLRAIGVTTGKRSVALPEVPPIAEAGLPGYDFASWYGVLAPAGTPEERVAALNGHLRNAKYQSDVAERLSREGAEIIVSSPAYFGRHLRAESARWAKVIEAAGLK
jgi:tripartite-type tricarboxylate transporter receptor subunit TctC